MDEFQTRRTRIEIVDLLLGKYLLTTSNGKEYAIEQEGNQFFLREGKKTLGRIVQNDHLGGSIWQGKKCLGEYGCRSGDYVVTPYSKGLKQPKQKENIHPLDYLIDKTFKDLWPRYIPSVIEDEGEN